MKGMLAAMLPSRFVRNRDSEELRSAERRSRSYWAVTCDIDYFRRFNDIYGRIAGDETLRRVGEALAQGCQSEEQVFNRGGSGFVIIFQDDSLDRAKLCADEHRATVEALQIPHQGSPLGVVTVSMGLATIVSGGTEATSEALEKADAALCRAKEAGPNQVAAAASLALV